MRGKCKCARAHISPNEFKLKAYTRIFDARSMIVGYMDDRSFHAFTGKYYNKIVRLSHKPDKNYGWRVYSRDGMPCGFTNGEIMIPAKGIVRFSDTWWKDIFSFLQKHVRYDFSYLTEDELVSSDPDFLIPNSSTLKKVYGKKTKIENELMFLCELVIFIEGYYLHLRRCMNNASEVLDGKRDPTLTTRKPGLFISKPLIDTVPYIVVGNVSD